VLRQCYILQLIDPVMVRSDGATLPTSILVNVSSEARARRAASSRGRMGDWAMRGSGAIVSVREKINIVHMIGSSSSVMIMRCVIVLHIAVVAGNLSRLGARRVPFIYIRFTT
jgi:hypothetical protein